MKPVLRSGLGGVLALALVASALPSCLGGDGVAPALACLIAPCAGERAQTASPAASEPLAVASGTSWQALFSSAYAR